MGALPFIRLLVPALFWASAPAQAEGPPNARALAAVQAGFLFQVAQFATWPSDRVVPGAPIRFCIVNDEAVAQELDSLVKGRTIDNRSLSVTRAAALAAAGHCDVAFIRYNATREMQEQLAAWTYPPVLLVGSDPGFAHMGGMVNLSVNATRMIFEVNLPAVRAARLQLRSQILKLAKLVNKPTRN